MELQGEPNTVGVEKTIREKYFPKHNLVANKYLIIGVIGKGKFGIVYKGEHVKNKTPVAIKMEPNTNECNTIKYEATILNYLHKNGCRVIPSVLWYGIYSDYKCLTMDYYEQTIEQYLENVKTKYASSPNINYLTQCVKLLINMVGILGQIHKHQIIHRDIKPENFMLKNGELFIIDFGIASAIDSLGEHETEAKRETIIGSPKYISYFIHDGYEPSYRDDLVSVSYCFLHFVLERLPWANISLTESNTQHVYSEIHVLHERNQIRKKLKGWNNMKTIFNKLSEKYEVYNYPKCGLILRNVFEYITLCYNLQLGEQPFYEELCQVLRKDL